MLIILLPRSFRPQRGALARRGSGAGRGVRAKLAKSKKRGRSSKRGRSRRGRNGKRGGRQDELADADVVTDDAAADPAAGGEGGEVGCHFQVITFNVNVHSQKRCTLYNQLTPSGV